MYWQYTPYELPLVVAAGASAALSTLAWRRRPTIGAVPFALLMLAVSEWSIGYAFELASANLSSILFWANLEYLGVLTIPVAWLAFALEYTGRERWLTRRNLAVLAIEPAAMLLLVWTDGMHGLIRGVVRLGASTGFTVLVSSHGIGFWLNVAYSYVLLLIGTLLISPHLQGLMRPNSLYRGQASMLLVAVATPWVSNFVYLSGLSPFQGLDLTPFAFTISGAALAWNLWRFHLLDIVPVARDAIIESMGAAVIVLDDQTRVLDLNPAAQHLLAQITGQQRRAGVGVAFDHLFAGWPDLVKYCKDTHEAGGESVWQVAATRRWYNVRISALRDRSGQLTGRLVMLDDITAHMQAEQALGESEERFRRIFQEAPIGMALLDLDSRILRVNRAFCDMLGYTEQELIGVALSALAHSEDGAMTTSPPDGVVDEAGMASTVEQRYVKKNHDTLWAERTTALIQNGGGAAYRLVMLQDVFERKRAALLEDVQRHIAYELHDGLAQVAAGAHLHLQAFAGHFRPRSAQAREELDRALELVQLAARETRHVIAGLRPTVVDELGLATALRMHVDGLRADGWDVTYDETWGQLRLPSATETALFRVALEALTNVRKHAGTTCVRVSLAVEGASVVLSVRDSGRGFQPSDVTTGGQSGHIGLHEMQERIALLGGRFCVQSQPGAGTHIVVAVPLPDRRPAETSESATAPAADHAIQSVLERHVS